MKIGKLDMHCGECSIIGYCGEAWSDIAICREQRFENIEELEFLNLAETSKRKTKKAIINDVYKKLSKNREEKFK